MTEVIRPKFGDPPIVIDHSGRKCVHEYVSLHVADHIAQCRVCSRKVDPFDVLLKLSHEWSWATHWAGEVAERAARVEELKREEQQVKARIKNAVRGAPEPKTVLYFEELMRRLQEAETLTQLFSVSSWQGSYKWLDVRQEAAVRDAHFRAKQRIEANGRRRGRKVEVLPGGKGR